MHSADPECDWLPARCLSAWTSLAIATNGLINTTPESLAGMKKYRGAYTQSIEMEMSVINMKAQHAHITVTSHGRHYVSNHQQFDCVFNSFFGLTTKTKLQLHITWLQRFPTKGQLCRYFKSLPKSQFLGSYHNLYKYDLNVISLILLT